MYKVTVQPKSWKLKKPFKISRGVQYDAEVIWCEISDGEHSGRGEAAGVTYGKETLESITAEVENIAGQIADGISREALLELMPAGGARNAVDCALWDLEAKQSGKTVWEMIGWQPQPVTTVYTVGMDDLDKIQSDAAEHSDCPILKVKVGIGDPIEQLTAIRNGAPQSSIVVDANQGWDVADLERYSEGLKALGVTMIEQPMLVADDEALRNYNSPLPLCADESCSTTADLERLDGLYSMVNIKLDKTGGLTEALALAEKALEMGFDLMVGNMLGSSLGMAPAFVIAQKCKVVDIDGPLLQKEDCDNAMHYEHGLVSVFEPKLWG
ncbi:MAG: dipeptide epimerase [Gammaproteobacteria bacterium]|nr:MAG: dipeptide epimerase [Gammaproteobacteria bacterium]RLA32212.1 MAG: dipeptide epimerase [Gammaproteobacteria bacterium]